MIMKFEDRGYKPFPKDSKALSFNSYDKSQLTQFITNEKEL